MLLNCTFSSYRNISFDVIFGRCPGNSIDYFDEGVEFSFRLCSSPCEWIPIKFIYNRFGNYSKKHWWDLIDIGEPNDNFMIRGYKVEQVQVNDHTTIHVNLCNLTLNSSIQFRWLQTSLNPWLRSNCFDVWGLDNIEINLVAGGTNTSLLSENFNSGRK